jgi:hypothetical protein
VYFLGGHGSRAHDATLRPAGRRQHDEQGVQPTKSTLVILFDLRPTDHMYNITPWHAMTNNPFVQQAVAQHMVAAQNNMAIHQQSTVIKHVIYSQKSARPVASCNCLGSQCHMIPHPCASLPQMRM